MNVKKSLLQRVVCCCNNDIDHCDLSPESRRLNEVSRAPVSTVNGEQSFKALLKRGCIDAANGVVTRSNPSSSSIDEDEGFFIVLIYFF